MKKQLLYLFGLMLLTSCDCHFVMSGKIVDELNGKPIEKAKIITSEKLITYSDSSGAFKFHRFGPCLMSDKLELLIEKNGYETKYIDLSKVSNLQDVTLKIRTTNNIQTTFWPKSLVKIFYFINLCFINLICLFTLIFIVIKKIKYKWIWFFMVFFITITFKINYINGLFTIDFLHSPFYLKYYGFYPFTVKIALPISLIIFWCLYFSKRKLIIETKTEQ